MHPFRFRLLPRLLLCLLAIALCRPAAQAAPVLVPIPPSAPAKPTLTVLAIGVSQYKDSSLSLQFPAQDAAAVAARFQAQEGTLFGKVVVTTLTDKAATREAIVGSLTALRKRAPQMGPNDCLVLFASGHGTNDDLGQYFFAPYDIDAANIDASGVSWTVFAQTLAQLPGHVLVLFDTSHAGGAVGGPNAAVLAACGKGGVSQESKDWNGGAFARALLDGLGGAADGSHDGVVTLTELADYARQRVPVLTKQAQIPVFVRPTAFPADLPLAAVPSSHSAHLRLVPIP